MCGIAGILSRGGTDGVVRAMVVAMRRRGPDSQGFFQDGDYRAGMCRLAINDVAGGDQPLFNADRSVALLYNGEIYNYPGLRRELEQQGVRFRTHSDGEVICHLYDRFGDDAFERLDGMFAAAIWDKRRRRLLLARDIPGEKPLYYRRLSTGGFAFASDIPALVELPGESLTLNRQSIWDLPTLSWIAEPDTIYREISALPRGSLLAVEAGAGITIRPIRNRFGGDTSSDIDPAKLLSAVRGTVEQSIERRLLSDVPVGSFLSSGLDSSIVVTVASRKRPDLVTFSVGFEDVEDPHHGRADESPDAAAYAARLGCRHVVVRATPHSFAERLPVFARRAGQPFAVSSGLGILSVAERARAEGIKVLLSGDGADECFGGYSWYAHLGKATARNAASCGRVDGVVSFNNVALDVGRRVAAIAAMPDAERGWAWHYYAHEREKAALFADGFGDGIASSLRHFDGAAGSSRRSEVDFIRHDRNFYLPMEMMRKLDLMTMAHSVEGRAPFVAPAVLALSDRLHYSDMIDPVSGELKTALRRAFADLLPPEVTARPKHGFNVPLDHWFRGSWRPLLEEAFAAGSGLRRYGIVDGKGRAAALALSDNTGRVSGHTLLSFVVLNLWLEQCHGNHR